MTTHEAKKILFPLVSSTLLSLPIEDRYSFGEDLADHLNQQFLTSLTIDADAIRTLCDDFLNAISTYLP